jgi:hypothetical protein
VKKLEHGPWAWPHDGLQHDKGSGKQLAEQYRGAGMNLTPTHATFEDETWGVEAGILQMHERMDTGKFKVLRTCELFFEEMRTYHREDGKIVKEMDDVISATRYAYMMRRFAESPAPAGWSRRDRGRRGNPLNR